MGEGQGSTIEQLNHVYILGKQRECKFLKNPLIYLSKKV